MIRLSVFTRPVESAIKATLIEYVDWGNVVDGLIATDIGFDVVDGKTLKSMGFSVGDTFYVSISNRKRTRRRFEND